MRAGEESGFRTALRLEQVHIVLALAADIVGKVTRNPLRPPAAVRVYSFENVVKRAEICEAEVGIQKPPGKGLAEFIRLVAL